ncbi:protein kinase [Streptomyces sp. NPDC048604]|uniref:serine/threonine-protein kinase n=1 Tax=Streptomyces sp. NPDC048604 TaxID=3365578 RepID=UPI0037200316
MEELRPEDPAAIGPYRLSARLGAGGMGRVYLGRSVSGRRVAVKAVRAEYAADPDFRRRFRREVEAARAVGGFWTAPVVDDDPDAEAPWVASAYIEAPDLGELVARRGTLTEEELRGLAAGLAEALQAVHRAGVVHRDLKPSNVLVTGDGPRVIDFGISKALEGSTQLTGSGTVVGTPAYMSPEQASGAEVGTASDVFSLGAVLAFAATGEGPFGAGSAPALLYRVVHDVPRLDGVPAGLRALVAACLEKAPERRPTPAELLELLSVGGDPGAVRRERSEGPEGPEGPEGRKRSERRGQTRTVAATEPGPTTPEQPPADPAPNGRTRAGSSPAAKTEVPSRPAPRDAGKGKRVEIRAQLARKSGEDRRGSGTEAFGVAVAVIAVLAVVNYGFGVLQVVGIAGGLVLVWIGHMEGEKDPLPESAIWANGWGLGFAYRRWTWNAAWTDVAEVTMELRTGADNHVKCVVIAVPKSGTSLPNVFQERRHSGAAVSAVPYVNRDAARPEVTRLDEALRRHAAGKYRRDPSLAGLVDF